MTFISYFYGNFGIDRALYGLEWWWAKALYSLGMLGTGVYFLGQEIFSGGTEFPTEDE
jgi:hypothetical protein